MDDTVLVSVIERQTDLDNDRNGIAPVEVSVLVDKVLNRDTLDIFLNDISEVTFVTYAEYLYDMGHRDIMMVCLRNNGSSMARAKSFLAEFMFNFPNCTVDPLFIQTPDPRWEEKFLTAMKRRKSYPTAVTCFGCCLQEGILQTFRKLDLEVPRDISILSHDNPDDFGAKVSLVCDALVFDLREITRLVEYFIACRPLVADGSRLTVSPEIRVEPHGTVAKIIRRSAAPFPGGMNFPADAASKIIMKPDPDVQIQNSKINKKRR